MTANASAPSPLPLPSPLPVLDAHDLARLAEQGAQRPACAACARLVCPGWEALPSDGHAAHLARVGTLRRPDDEDPTLAEHHPAGTHYWSADAPVSAAHFPYNRCDVWQCPACRHAFLRYTEYGGYYQQARIRALPAWVV
jgi:hypothetical protein